MEALKMETFFVVLVCLKSYKSGRIFWDAS